MHRLLPKRLKRFAKALATESGKRVPYIIAIAFLIWLGGAWVQFNKTTENIRATKSLTSKVVSLTRQNKVLTKQNKNLTNRTIYYNKCLLSLFANYTRTQEAIHITDVSKCETDSINKTPRRSNIHSGSTPRPDTENSAQAPRHTSGSTAKKDNEQPTPQSNPSVVRRILNFLGV